MWSRVVMAGLAGGGVFRSAGVSKGADPVSKGFVDRTHRAEDGVESRYVVFVPATYDGKAPLPVIVFLHGSGHTGTDGRDQLTGSLAAAIGPMESSFAFLAVFP